MAIKAKFVGREAVTRRLRQLVPDAEKEAAKAQLAAAEELASAIRARAPGTGDYAQSIVGDKLSNRPAQGAVGITDTKDPNATGIFADYKWKWLEFGTAERTVKKTGQTSGKMPAQAHIFPTYRAMRKRIRRMVAGAVNKAVRKARG